MAAPSYPVIVVPGITATYLRDEYPFPPEIIWAVLNKDYERAALHPDNPRYEALEPARVAPDQLYEVAYKELLAELRFNLREREDQPVPVFAFAYDWRQPLETVEQQLATFIDEVIERTRLLRHYLGTPFAETPKVNLVGHSMGGLIISGYLQRSGKKSNVAKVVTLATPFQGSFEAVIKIITGTANLGTSAPSSREREAARVTPSLYHLLPSFDGCLEIDGEAAAAKSLFDPQIWQPSVTDTIAEFIRLHGLAPAGRKEQAQNLFAAFLQQSAAHRKRTDALKLENVGLTSKDWLCVVGVGAVTRVRLKVVSVRGKPDFELRSSDRDDKWSSHDQGERILTGDGTVPFKGALPRFLDITNIVCVTPEDYGYWEIQDRALTRLSGFHGILPNMNMLNRLIVRHLTGRGDKHRNTWGRMPPGVTKDRWSPPLPLDPEPPV